MATLLIRDSQKVETVHHQLNRNQMWSLHMEYYSAIKKNKALTSTP